MSVLKVTGLIALGTVGVLGVSAGGSYMATNTDIKTYLKEELLDEGSTEDWKALQKKLNDAEDIEKYMDASLQSIKKQGGDGASYGTGIKSWCNKNKDSKINPFITLINRNLLEAVSTFCIRTIEERLGNSKLNLDNDSEVSEKLKSKVGSINSHDANTNGNLEKELKSLKAENKDTDWQKLRDWCKKTYKRGYQGNNNRWKLANHFCK